MADLLISEVGANLSILILCILIRSNKMQLTQVFIYCKITLHVSGCLSHPSSGVHQTVTAASGTGHSI